MFKITDSKKIKSNFLILKKEISFLGFVFFTRTKKYKISKKDY